MNKTYSSVFEYPGYQRTPSHCQIDIWSSEEQAIVMMSEIADNHGTSVTNRSEVIASLVCFQHNLSGYDITWIEHYPREEPHNSLLAETFSIVTYDWKRGEARHPQWEYITREQFEALIG
jgi:hypothetical protein